MIFIDLFTFENPKEFKDEEMWMVVFSLRSFIWLLGGIGFWVILVMVLDLGLIGHLIGAPACVFVTVINMFETLGLDYMKGGKILLFNSLLRRYCHRKNDKVLYVRNYDSEIEELKNRKENNE